MADNSSEQAAPEITCREVAERVSACLDDHVDDLLQTRIVLHLAGCAGCEAYLKQIASIRDVLGLLPGAIVEPIRRGSLRKAFAARRSRPPSTT